MKKVSIGRPAADLTKDRRVADHVAELLSVRELRPLTAGFMQQTAKTLGHQVGRKRAAAMVGHLKASGAIEERGRYRGKHGFWVRIYRIRRRIPTSSLVTGSVRRNSQVKRQGWWNHGLFGNPEDAKPTGVDHKTLQKWRSPAFERLEIMREMEWLSSSLPAGVKHCFSPAEVAGVRCS